jgi:peptide deformylase
VVGPSCSSQERCSVRVSSEAASCEACNLPKETGRDTAANQIGEEAAVAVIEVRKTDFFPDRPESPLYVMVNPRIVERSDTLVED